MSKLSKGDKVLWKNFFTCLFIFIVAVVLLGFTTDEVTNEKFGFLESYIILSSFSVIALCYKLALPLKRNEEVDEFRVKRGLTIEEFNKKYGEVLELMD
jgi:hypothetical protein